MIDYRKQIERPRKHLALYREVTKLMNHDEMNNVRLNLIGQVLELEDLIDEGYIYLPNVVADQIFHTMEGWDNLDKKQIRKWIAKREAENNEY
jgi:hypothetical protein